MNENQTLPDVTSRSLVENLLPLRWVGMEKIATPIILNLNNNELQKTLAHANIYVSLDNPNAKGIHMSRLHAIVNKLAQNECNPTHLESLLDDAIASQPDISSKAKINLSFELLLKKPSLLSNEAGYQSYPVTISAESAFQANQTKNNTHYEISLSIPYSSTCPCSASLARQLYANAIEDKFKTPSIDKQKLLEWIQSDAGSVATPHSQRSYAHISMTLTNDTWPELSSLIFQFEKIIGTAVQTAVKRVDEQEFARLNATNLMFCEDAARRLKKSLETMPFVSEYSIKVDHQESLHAHNAVVIDNG